MENYTLIDTHLIESPLLTDDLFENRRRMARLSQGEYEVTLIVVAYNRLENVKKCIESILKYSGDVSYELVLIDNGSSDGILEYFQSVEYEHKRIIRITKNLGAFYPIMTINFASLGEFFCYINDDACVTPHWLENLLICIKSDPHMGLAAPMYFCPLRDAGIELPVPFVDYEDMLEKSERCNVSDSRKWRDMVGCTTFCTLYRKEAVLSIGWPYWDLGFHHDFADMDVGFRLRRMGYRTVQAGDTWVYHDHPQDNARDAELDLSYVIGNQNLGKKYFGITMRDIVSFSSPYFPPPYLKQLPAPLIQEKMSVLGVDIGCGTSALDVKNWLISQGASSVEMSAFTRDPKFWVDLKTICSGDVVCDREEFLLSDFPTETFDCIVAENPINCYHDPQAMLQALFRLCAKGGYVICKLFNAFSFREYLTILGGQGEYTAQKLSCNISVERFRGMLESYGEIRQQVDMVSTREHDLRLLQEALPEHLTEEQKKAVEEMKKFAYMFVVEK